MSVAVLQSECRLTTVSKVSEHLHIRQLQRVSRSLINLQLPYYLVATLTCSTHLSKVQGHFTDLFSSTLILTWSQSLHWALIRTFRTALEPIKQDSTQQSPLHFSESWWGTDGTISFAGC